MSTDKPNSKKSNDIAIRPLRHEELSEARELQRRAFELDAAELMPLKWLHVLLGLDCIPAYNVLLAAFDTSTNTMLGNVVCEFKGDKTMYLYRLATAPEQQGRGVGTRLFAEAWREAQVNGCRRMVWTNAPRLTRYYEKLGAVVIDEASPRYPSANGDDGIRVIMQIVSE